MTASTNDLQLALRERARKEEAKANARELGEMLAPLYRALRPLWTLVLYGAVVYAFFKMDTRDLVLFGIMIAFIFYMDSRESDKRNAQMDDGNR